MLDCISGGRLVAGLPLGSPMDVNLAYGITPMEHRERYREAFDLVLKAWQAKEIFAWNGKYFQLGQVNLWPRPIQQPHPPVWVPGSGSISTFDFAAEHNVCYCFLCYAGARAASTMMDGYWDVVDKKGLERNPYRAGFLQLVAVSETDAQAEADYAQARRVLLPQVPARAAAVVRAARATRTTAACWRPTATRCGARRIPRRSATRTSSNKGYVIAGSPATVRERLVEEVIKRLHVGNLMVLIQIGSMPHELTLKNIELFAREVLPGLREIWDDEGWENHWWPRSLRGARQTVGAAR